MRGEIINERQKSKDAKENENVTSCSLKQGHKNSNFLSCVADRNELDHSCCDIKSISNKYSYIRYENNCITIYKNINFADITMQLIATIIVSILVGIISLSVTNNAYLSILLSLIIFIFFYNGRTGIKHNIFPCKTILDLNKNEIIFVLNILCFKLTKIVKTKNSKFNVYTYYRRSGEYFTDLEIRIDKKLFIIKKYKTVNSINNENALIIANSLNNLLSN